MNVSPAVIVLLAALGGISGFYFYRGRELTLLRRAIASAHGVLALLTLPLAIFAAVNGVERDSVAAIAVVYGCSILSLGSIIYSIRALGNLGYFHLLHILTFAGVLATSFGAALVVGGPG